MRTMKTICAGVVILLAGWANAAPIVEGPGAFTYTYHAGSDVADTNASNSGTSFYIEAPSGGNAAYYATTTAHSSGDVIYTFQAAPGFIFGGSVTTQEDSLVAFNPGGSVIETVTPNVGLPTTTTLLSASDAGFYTDYTAHSFNVYGATSFTIDFQLNNPSGNAIFTQVFREGNGSTGTPLLVSGVTVPEPSSIVIAGLGAIGLFVVARRRRKA